MIQIKNIEFSYRKDEEVLKDVSIQIPKGSYTTIIGHNGSGKSTIARLMIGLLPLQKGSIVVDDLDVVEENYGTLRKKMGIVFQNPDNQFIGTTVADDIAFGLENNNVKHEDMQSIIETYASKVHMEKFLLSEPGNLSGGQKQRVAIAGVLAMQPDIVIFDEATSMLDPKGKKEIKEVIHELHDKEDVTIVSITHDMEEVAHSDYVVVLDQGTVFLEGQPEEVLIRKDELLAIGLDIPFALKFQQTLQEKGIDLPKKVTLEGMVDAICQYKSKI